MKWRTREELEQILVSAEDAMDACMVRMDESGLAVVLVVDADRKLIGVVTDGDVRRGLLSGQNLKDPLKKVMQTQFHALPSTAADSVAKDLMCAYSFRHIPLVDENGVIQDLVAWKDFFEAPREKFEEKIVIMAGGKGTRLDPFTKILPKPMIPIGDKPILEVIIDKFTQQGFSEFILSLGYKSEIIRLYFAEHASPHYNISYVYEEKPLGTAGALGLMKEKLDSAFIVINCDVIVDLNFSKLLHHHRNEQNDLTVVATQKEYSVPYGVLKTNGQELISIDEKPNFHYLINTGLYVLEPSVLRMVEQDEFMNMTDLMLEIKKNGGKVGVYPHHGTWFDIGQWEDYRNSLRHMGIMD